MKYKYLFHPGEYAIGDNERFYTDQAARGWQLVKRGGSLSKFRRTERQAMRYRIELSAPAILDDPELPEEQLALYEESGWSFVTQKGLVNVFSSPEGSDAPEFYTDPRQQAATLKALRRNYNWGWLIPALLLAFNLLLSASMSGGMDGALSRLSASCGLGFYQETALLLLYGVALIWSVSAMFYGWARTAALYRRLKKGKPLDHQPSQRRIIYKIINRLFALCFAVCLLLTVVQWCRFEKGELPTQPGEPYLLLSELGFTGERTTNYLDKTSSLELSHSLAADRWDCYECVETSGNSVSLYQDIYVLRGGLTTERIVPLIMNNSIFGRSVEGYSQVELPGLDAEYLGGLDCIGVKGNVVWYFTFLSNVEDPNQDSLKLLTALGQRYGG